MNKFKKILKYTVDFATRNERQEQADAAHSPRGDILCQSSRYEILQQASSNTTSNNSSWNFQGRQSPITKEIREETCGLLQKSKNTIVC
jgi:hypothetical protein